MMVELNLDEDVKPPKVLLTVPREDDESDLSDGDEGG